MSSKAPLISVVMPAFNAARFIAEALESVLAELTADPDSGFEVVVADDCSNDATADIVRSFAARGVRYLKRPARGGPGAARNSGVGAAEGELLAFLDADDLWPAGRLAALKEALEGEGGPAIAFGHMRQFACPSLAPALRGRLRVPEESRPGYCAGAMLLRRADFLRIGSFSEALAIGEFIEWFGRARDLGFAIALIAEIVLERRIHGANTSMRRNSDYANYARALKGMLDRRRPSTAS
jgi:glycosyltransferase involved in cell wall biosynthesis